MQVIALKMMEGPIEQNLNRKSMSVFIFSKKFHLLSYIKNYDYFLKMSLWNNTLEIQLFFKNMNEFV